MGKELINIIGYGFVGQANGLGLKRLGYEVKAYDIIKKKNIYKDKDFNKIPLEIKEKPKEGINIICIAEKNGRKQDINHIKKAISELKGTVIVRTTILPRLVKEVNMDFYWVEFLKERTAVLDFLNPELTVVGRRNKREFPIKEFKPYYCSPEEASHIKYLSNIWNALRIAFVNEFGDNLEGENINKKNVLDSFFKGEKYLKWGNAYGGHCLPKDSLAYSKQYPHLSIIKSFIQANEKHRKKYPYLKSIY